MWIIRFLAAVSLFCAFQAIAVEQPLTYMRSSIALALMDPPQSDKPPTPHKIINFDVDIREAGNFRNQQGWYSLSGLSERRGVLVMENAPGIVPLEPAQQYAPLDVLMLEDDGTITQIFPSIVLAEMAQPINSAKPVQALLYLQGGTTEREGIKPSDKVEYQAFRKKTVMLGTTPPAAQNSAVQTQQAAPTRPVDINDLLNAPPAKAPKTMRPTKK